MQNQIQLITVRSCLQSYGTALCAKPNPLTLDLKWHHHTSPAWIPSRLLLWDQTYNGCSWLRSTLNTHSQVNAIMLDFSKAFDKVSHTKLIHTLQYYGINGKALLWLSAFLTNRSQFVSVEGSHSSHTKVFSGVPHGRNVLGPTLFLVFINDIVNYCDSNTRLFADDTVIHRTISADHALQRDLARQFKILGWLQTGRLAY